MYRPTRDETLHFGNDFLSDILEHIANNYTPQELYGDRLLNFVVGEFEPEDVCKEQQLIKWAEYNDYVKGQSNDN